MVAWASVLGRRQAVLLAVLQVAARHREGDQQPQGHDHQREGRAEQADVDGPLGTPGQPALRPVQA